MVTQEISNSDDMIASAQDGSIRVTYHATDIVTFWPDLVTLNTGGYRTVTTKRKMNQAANQFGLGYSVYQKDYNWFVCLPSGENVAFDDRTISFSR